MKRIFMALAVAIWPLGALAAPMSFDFMCTGNAVEACFIYAKGEIVGDTDAAFERFLKSEQIEGNQIVLHSQGGNLGAGVRLGRLIRDAELTAIVGEPKPREGAAGMFDFPTAGVCSSACAYAFLGGKNRRLIEGSKLGFHQFYMGVQGNSASAQKVSGALVTFLVEMGIDPRIFARASTVKGAENMYWVEIEEAEQFDLITPFGYDTFFLEPFGKGIVAASKRQNAPGPYDAVYQVTAFCRGGVPKLLFTATWAPERAADFDLRLDGKLRVTNAASVKTRRNYSVGYLDVTLSRQDADAMTRATQVTTGFQYARAEGGYYGTRLNLTDMDRKMLEAAFRLCL